ncbi:unnamed protein product [Rotaria socialis]|uniref:Tyrosine-protein kinase ephrin type A/B receptor-like domain-containing protein n=1 Tax=Rotaria socialis TaxID=392032 RepID=A0A820WLY6_9BILA|nr:unnamed protein product [Rotaria socialis]CAF4516637.1 unnamed protein product [Rotaria socialis]
MRRHRVDGESFILIDLFSYYASAKPKPNRKDESELTGLHGTYHPNEAAVSVGACLSCSTGTYNPNTGKGNCTRCPHGTYCDTTGTTSYKECPPETYQPSEGAISAQTCLKCPAGTSHPLSAGYECYRCPESYTCNDPDVAPIAISNGTSSTSAACSSATFPTIDLSTSDSSASVLATVISSHTTLSTIAVFNMAIAATGTLSVEASQTLITMLVWSIMLSIYH